MTTRHTNQIICQERWTNLKFWKNEPQNLVRIFWLDLIFWAKTFLWTLRTCSRYLKSLPVLALCVSKKPWPHCTPVRLYIRKTEKIEILKKWSSKLDENILIKHHDFNILQVCVVRKFFRDFKSSNQKFKTKEMSTMIRRCLQVLSILSYDIWKLFSTLIEKSYLVHILKWLSSYVDNINVCRIFATVWKNVN